MYSIRSLVLIAGLALLLAPGAFAEGDEGAAEPQKSAVPGEATAEAPEAAAPAPPPAKLAAPPQAETQAAAAASEAPAEPAAQVTRAVFTTAVADREPSDELSVVPSSTSRVYFFTELSNLQGQRVIHRWEQGGQVRAEVAFDVGGPRWRVWSSKQILPEWTGEWRVTVLEPDGTVLASKSFSYQAPE